MLLIVPVKQESFEAITSWIYLHGQLEHLNKFDLCRLEAIGEANPVSCTVIGEYFVEYHVTEGTYPCTTVIGKEVYPSKLFLWETQLGYKGLVVSCSDPEGLEYAEKKFEEKPEFI